MLNSYFDLNLDVLHAASNVVSLIYKLITSNGDSDDLPIGFGRDRNRRQRDLRFNKKKEKCHLTFMLIDVFRFAGCH